MSSPDNAPVARQSDSAWLRANGWRSMYHFMLAYNLRIWDDEHYAEAKQIVAAFREKEDEEEAEAYRQPSTDTQQKATVDHDTGNHARGGTQEEKKPSTASGNISKEAKQGDKKPIAYMGNLQVSLNYDCNKGCQC